MHAQTTIFDHDVRVVACENCGGPLQTSLAGGAVACRFCGAGNQVRMRDEVLAVPQVAIAEPERIARLRTQDGRPMLPPPSLAQLVPGGQLPPWKVQEAVAVWLATRRELRQSPSSYEAAERLMFLTMILSNHFAKPEDQLRRRAMLESALEVATLPRHKNVLRGYLSRSAARIGDLRAAEQWLAACDPRSDDLESDSAWRMSKAMLETARGRWGAVIEALGQTAHDVPIHDAMDSVCALLRANAWERLGQLDRAVALLREYLAAGGAGGRTAVARILEAHRDWSLCAQSFPLAQQAHTVQAGRVASSRASGGIGNIFFFLGVAFLLFDFVAVVVMLLAWLTDLVPGVTASIMGTAMFTLVPLGVVFTAVGAWARKVAARAKWLRENGLSGTAQVVGLSPTGMRINGVPMMQFDLMIQLDGRSPYRATAKALASGGVVPPGAVVSVRVDPRNPQDVLIEMD